MDSIVKHAPNTYYLELRQDYITLCMSLTYRKDKSKSSPHCKALILSIMEKWTNHKISKGRDPHISMTYSQWIDEMYSLFARNAIIDSLDELTHEGLLQREAFKSPRGGRDQYKYLLEVEELNKKLNPTFTNQPCEEEQSGKVNDQGLQINDATSKNQSCSSSPTLKSKPFIESDTQSQSIKLEKKEPVLQSIEEQKKQQTLSLALGTELLKALRLFGEYSEYMMSASKEVLAHIYSNRPPEIDESTFKILLASAKEEANRATLDQAYQLGFESKTAYFMACLHEKLHRQSSRDLSLQAV